MTKGEHVKKYKEFGEGILAVANLCSKNKQNSNINKANFSMNKPKSCRNTIEVFTVGNTSMISMLERVTCTTFRQRTRRLESNWKNSQGKQPLRKPNYKNKLQGQNSMSLLQIFIIQHLRKLFLVCIILHIRNSNLRHLTSIQKRI